MNYKEFDPQKYFRAILANCKYATNKGFQYVSVSGINDAEEVVSKMRTTDAFFAFDETADGTIDIKPNGPFINKTYTILILHRYKFNDEKSRLDAMNICRTLMLKIAAWIIKDSEKLKDAFVYVDQNTISREIGQALFNNLTGLYFSFSFSRPTDLIIDDDDWEDPDLDVTTTNILFDDSFDSSFN